MFPCTYAIFQPYRNSDHSPAVLKIPTLSFTKPKPFKFYNFLAYKGGFLEMVSNQWNVQVAFQDPSILEGSFGGGNDGGGENK
ncbi:reverse transcriptase domain, Reverse transcriptase zinc-binding domain protein [Artemisia annua]|uniref:Reverse transcriptase domain, Reverse transcriptase zinc-binding domain protein n=1 Tax=Artemisia annua TaxID=35608 RepID=A0A2U1P5Q0_ARTAN|nr:reverse transcriptase domain, Reverse transcriptase zinc-binding domain protein [Artemisia annua]